MVADYICLFTGTTCISLPFFLGAGKEAKRRDMPLAKALKKSKRGIFEPLETANCG